MHKFSLKSAYKPAGSQPEAMEQLVAGLQKKMRLQTLLGVTGSGKSLDYNDPIFVTDKSGLIQKAKIGEFVEKHLSSPNKLKDTEYQKLEGFKITSFNPKTLEIENKDILEVSRHKETVLYEITLDDNSTINVTKDHNCYRFRNCRMDLCRTDELEEGDFLPTSNRFPTPEQDLKSINLLDYCPNRKLSIDGLIEKYDPGHKKILEALRTTRAPQWKLNQILGKTKERGITKEQLFGYLKKLNLDFEEASPYIKIITQGDQLAPILPITEDFLTFAGLYVSEGHSTGKYLLISNSDKNLQETCKRLYDGLGLNYHQRSQNDLQYYSILMANIFSTFGRIASTKNVPSLIYNLSNRQLSVFLRAVFDGDGYVEKNSVNLTSASKELINDLRNLLLRYGIVARVSIKPFEDREFYVLRICGRDNLRRYKYNISFSIDYKRDKLKVIIPEKTNPNVDLIPNSSKFFMEIREKYSLSQRDIAGICGCERSYISMIEGGKRSPSKAIFSKIANWLSKKDPAYSPLKNLQKFNLRKIIRIKKTKPTKGYVYDLSIKDNETFMAGQGNVFVHNTFTMANVIEHFQKPTLVLAHNKTLAAQLFTEFKEFFPKNRVEYFVSYFDYYQPESYLPQKDMYIEKDSKINDKIEQMRLSATASLISRPDTIIVSSVSCIYGLGDPKFYRELGFEIRAGGKIERRELLKKLIKIQFERNDTELMPARFRVKGDTVDFIPAYGKNIVRVEMFGDSIERIRELDKDTGEIIHEHSAFYIFPARHFVTPEEEIKKAVESIKAELEGRLPELDSLEAHRLKQRTLFDIEMLEETGYCKGIENYSRHFDGRKPGEPPYCLLDYFPKDFLMIIDESHQSLPQVRGMYSGDYSRKKTLVDYGFRLPSAFDNRPLKFHEFEKFLQNAVFVSATPGDYELANSSQLVEQIIRPTGLIDPQVEVRPIEGQIENVIGEIKKVIERGERALLTTLTKKLAEELTDFLASRKIRTRYLHSEIETIERTEIIRELRLGKFDVLVGINLLREGLDIPELGFIGILDADKEGFLRDYRSLIQIIGRASRNVNARVILYADNMTDSMKKAIDETERRRHIQMAYNKAHGIVPKTIMKAVPESQVKIKSTKHIPKSEIPNLLVELEAKMKGAAEMLDFEKAIELRDRIEKMKNRSDL
jgi:excinuclease ABC subunit B